MKNLWNENLWNENLSMLFIHIMFNTYAENKRSYDLLKSMTNEIITNVSIPMVGGNQKTIKNNIISDKEKETILKKYNEIVSGDKKCTSYPRDKIEIAASGMYINENERKSKTSAELCSQIKEAHDEKHEPFIHNDSLTAWGNEAVARFGLTVGDIMKMKFGDKIEIIMFDRNVGEYTDAEAGDKYDPKKEGCTNATYIHGEGLTGILNMPSSGIALVPFTWEINREAIGDNIFWGPINGCDCRCGVCSKTKKEPININKLDKNIKVGWRGPAILMSDAKKYLPDKVKHYDTWWDDYMPFKKDNLSKIK